MNQKDKITLSSFTSRSAWIEILVALGAIVMILPVALIFLTSFKPDSEIIHFGSIFPRDWTLANYRQVLGSPEEIPIFRWFMNSVFISAAITALVLIVDSLAAFALARLDLPGGRAVFALILATLMVPGQICLVPVYLMLNSLGWIDTPWALIVPAGAGAFGVFLLRQFFLGIPRDLEDAAAIDGCSRFGVYRRIALPLAKPALATLAIFVFVGSWNDFLGPLVFLDSVDQFTLPVGLALYQSSYMMEYGLILAACALSSIPALVIFLAFQRHIIEGIALTGLKD